jgi:hypothetical protein
MHEAGAEQRKGVCDSSYSWLHFVAKLCWRGVPSGMYSQQCLGSSDFTPIADIIYFMLFTAVAAAAGATRTG